VARDLSIHTFPPNAFTKHNLIQLAQLASKDPVVTSVRFEGNLAEGKMYCIFEAPNKATLETWLKDHQMPTDWITQVGIGCDGGAAVREI